MSFSGENAQGLLLNTLQRFKAQADPPDQMRMCYSRIMLSRLRQVNTLSLCAASLRKRRPSAAGSLPRTHSAGPVVSDLLSPI
jgi:hypothetical protein